MSEKTTDISAIIKDSFGANASYVESLYKRYSSDPDLVDDSWKRYFSGLVEAGNGAATEQAPKQTAETSSGASQTAAQPAPAKEPDRAESEVREGVEAKAIFGPSKIIVENMEESLSVPTATSVRRVPVKILEENRRVINDNLIARGMGKVSFTHLIGWAIIKAIREYPAMNVGFGVVDGKPSRLISDSVNFGVAIDIEKKDGSRNLLVPNIKGVDKMDFLEFFNAFNNTIKRARSGELKLDDFQGTTITLTNPGTIGTVASNPRLMAGQAAIIATGAIEFPAEYQGMTSAALSQLGISKIMTVTSTYDHRVIQGAESGLFLAKIHQYLTGNHLFYDEIFSDLEIHYPPLRWAEDFNPSLLGSDYQREQVVKQAKVLQLIDAYRVRGHLLADIDPLNMTEHTNRELDLENFGLTIWDLDREFITDGLHGKETSTLREILWVLRRAYCGKVGIEYRHIQDVNEKKWLREKIRQQFVDTEPLDPNIQKELLRKLIQAEQFEQFLHRKYLGQKRFSLEGCETLIPLLDQLVEISSVGGVEEIMMGMAHRGRLNVLANTVGNSETGDMAERIFTAFEGTAHPSFPADEGDVKYHQGASGKRTTKTGNEISIRLSCNPSHLEFVDPVVEGMARARQDQMLLGDDEKKEEVIDRVLPILLHGDAAFAGQGIVMETLQLANLRGYRTGGTIHIVVNNQIGFTTAPEASRSSIYSTDAAHMTQLPIFHINGDSPESAWRVAKIALEYRQEFNKDVALDLVGFRRLGHNEGDEPSYTQPLMYQRVKEHPGVRDIYARELIQSGVLTEEEVKAMTDEVVSKYESILENAKKIAEERKKTPELAPPIEEEDGSAVLDTGVPLDTLKEVTNKISIVPEDFNVNPKMVGQLGRRAKMGSGESPMDWGFAEAMAFGTLVLDGKVVRLSGQDSGRGTFSHRHSLLYDTQTGAVWCPLAELRNSDTPEARFHVFDSSLSEAGVLGFEYGYSTIEQDALVIWEAQFGDFSNGAQVIIDQYIAASEDKWNEKCRLVMLLPHGYEGQGPEHSSARLERYLTLCAENNLQVCNPTTPAQYFHMLRRQVMQESVRPLVVMTPKSLLRLPAATSDISELSSGGFKPVIEDTKIEAADKVERLLICSGKVFYDLDSARDEATAGTVAIARLEQFYPFPKTGIEELVSRFKNLKEVVWVQEEPKNMGGWMFVAPRLSDLFAGAMPVSYVGREPSASPATGNYIVHELEQNKLLNEALGIDH
ncbi:MAG: multifunctional oxoglutarate decarboxylase/oxoglutarate dehydrogenase thiamine pyrophosphate-binding subunit/dihydrolipoyllysine-residue succinyltransferase subunit [Acidobacteria bacterium]|nr:MAG: multifunctional oxoglutarate decarboxylase/oxoglutarate dehydrogenase thiamine pyrophosphate-binding subunit/dihydrolipoyllysine-residue succinyltransferase subunit [Acidobacteriota bacterium]REK03978.1 MAG: multifunctional oxoglutarate decarboxylase/oxoglutarate dehydrogenase thiamine pyrophosphate-binding subunit/dihydrolipoyllysine-residue succinyltransferase subunit [Acidobacteriota bacterium]REK15140.1 MAG: multifunctional oxoglutarate decarboxylase/oxoglutarate dehydrogenase thiamin